MEGGMEEEGVRWEVLGNSYRMYVLLKRRVASTHNVLYQFS